MIGYDDDSDGQQGHDDTPVDPLLSRLGHHTISCDRDCR